MLTKMNIFNIVESHVLTFRNNGTKKIIKSDLLIYLILPFLISFVIVFNGDFILTDNNSNVFLTAFSIFAALLFNMLLLVFDIVNKSGTDNISTRTEKAKIKINLLHETFTNISFTVLLSVSIVILLLIYVIFNTHLNIVLPIYSFHITPIEVLTFIVVSFIIMFIFSFLMILKRVNILLSKEI